MAEGAFLLAQPGADMTTTVTSVISRAATILQDVAMSRWTQAMHLTNLNEGMLALVNIKPDANTKTATVALVAGAKQTMPADCIGIVELRQNQNGASILPCDRGALDAFSHLWMTTPTANTVKHYMDDPQPSTFYVYPAQSASPASVVMTYVAIPATVAYGDNIGVRDIYADSLVSYLLYKAYAIEDEAGAAEKSLAYLQMFKGA